MIFLFFLAGLAAGHPDDLKCTNTMNKGELIHHKPVTVRASIAKR